MACPFHATDLTAVSFEKISRAEKRRRMNLYTKIWDEVEREISKFKELIRQETLAELRELEKYFSRLRRGVPLAASKSSVIPSLTAQAGQNYQDNLNVTLTTIQDKRSGSFEIRVNAVLQNSGQEFSKSTAETLGVTASGYSVETEGWIKNHIPRIVDDIGTKRKKAIFREVAAGTKKGETLDQIEGRIRGRYNQFSRSSSAAIARTEVGFVHAQAGWNTVKSLAIPNNELVKIWLTARDGRVRGLKLSDHANHVVLDGQRRMFLQRFSNGLLYPRQPGGKASQVVNCRCVLLYQRTTKPGSTLSTKAPRSASILPLTPLGNQDSITTAPIPQESAFDVPPVIRDDVKQAVSSLNDTGKSIKKNTDSLLKSIAEDQGGQLYGSQHSLKTQSAIANKLARLVTEENMTIPQAMDSIHDINRYTLVFEEPVFDSKVGSSILTLGSEGWTLASKNEIDSDLYRGVNADFIQNGNYLEVQFHTPETVASNEAAHTSYKDTQKPSATDSQIEAAEDAISGKWV